MSKDFVLLHVHGYGSSARAIRYRYNQGESDRPSIPKLVTKFGINYEADAGESLHLIELGICEVVLVEAAEVGADESDKRTDIFDELEEDTE